jgi:CheY-like chemotaxis protein
VLKLFYHRLLHEEGGVVTEFKMAQKVLVIDDEELLRNLVVKLLEMEGYTVLAASSGDEGLELARKEGCDLVLLDLLMPGRDGWSVLEEMKGDAGLRDIPVVLWTASPPEFGGDKARAMGASDYLLKPVKAEELIARLRAALSGKGD